MWHQTTPTFIFEIQEDSKPKLGLDLRKKNLSKGQGNSSCFHFVFANT